MVSQGERVQKGREAFEKFLQGLKALTGDEKHMVVYVIAT